MHTPFTAGALSSPQGRDVPGDKLDPVILSGSLFSRHYYSIFIPLNSFCIR